MSNSVEIIARSEECMLRVYPHALQRVFSKGKGSRIWDSEEREYIDFSSGLGVNVLGFAPEGLTEAISKQAQLGTHCSNLFYHESQLALAELLCAKLQLPKAYFSNSGAEANEAAIKAVRRWGSKQTPLKNEIICFEQGWHGRSIATISACKDEQMQQGFGPLLEGFVPVPMFELDAIAAAVNENTAAVMIEPLIGHGGIHAASAEFLKKLRSLCDERGIKLIFDEIQSCGGRTGSFCFFEQKEVRPDVVSLGKGLSGGVPLGATLMSDDIASSMSIGSHGSTFGGNPLSTAAALFTCSLTTNENFLAESSERAEYMKAELEEICSRSKFATAMRAIGFVFAIDVPHSAKRLTLLLAEEGVITTALGQNCLRLMPALNISREEIILGLEALERGLKRAESEWEV